MRGFLSLSSGSTKGKSTTSFWILEKIPIFWSLVSESVWENTLVWIFHVLCAILESILTLMLLFKWLLTIESEHFLLLCRFQRSRESWKLITESRTSNDNTGYIRAHGCLSKRCEIQKQALVTILKCCHSHEHRQRHQEPHVDPLAQSSTAKLLESSAKMSLLLSRAAFKWTVTLRVFTWPHWQAGGSGTIVFTSAHSRILLQSINGAHCLPLSHTAPWFEMSLCQQC